MSLGSHNKDAFSKDGNLIEEEENKDNIDKNEESNEPIELYQYINEILDNMGFTKYHFFLFLTSAFFLFCSGMQEIIHVILLSIINDTLNLTFYHLALMNSIEYLGYTIATIIVNIITNYLSRKRAIQITVISSLIFTGLSLTTYNFYFAAFNRLFLGFCFGILDILIYLNLFESAPTEIRGYISSLIQLFFPLGAFVLSVICYFQLIEGDHKINYKFLLLIPFIITSVLVILLVIFVEESPRNLFGKNDFMEGVEAMKKISKFNKDDDFIDDKFNFNENKENNPHTIELEDMRKKQSEDKNNNNNISIKIKDKIKRKEDKFNTIIHSNKKKLNIENIEEYFKKSKHSKNSYSESFKDSISLILNKTYIYYTIIFWLIASLAGFVFNGIFFMLPATAPKINKQTFFDLVLFEGMEIPSNFIASLLIESTIGRINILRIGFGVTFLISLIIIWVGESILIFSCLLKFFLTMPSIVLIVYSCEIYDSNVRTMGISSLNFWKKISSLFSPFCMSYLTIHYGEFSTNFIYAPFLCFCTIATIFLKTESKGIPLDEIVKINYL